jgi:hypothetical protein
MKETVFHELPTTTLLRMAAGRVYEDARTLQRVATIGGTWDDPRDQAAYEHDIALHRAILDRADELERQEKPRTIPEWASEALTPNGKADQP